MGGGNNGASPSFLSFSSLPPPPPAVAQYALPTTKISLSLSLSLSRVCERKGCGPALFLSSPFAFLCSFFFSRLRRDRFLLLFLPPLPCPPSGAPEISKSQIISSKSASVLLLIVGLRSIGGWPVALIILKLFLMFFHRRRMTLGL